MKNENIQNTKRKGFTCRKLSEKYFLNYGIKVSHATVNNTLKASLGLKYLKVKSKTNETFVRRECSKNNDFIKNN